MGIHVSLMNAKREEHPDWDYVRHAGDREIPCILEELETVYLADSDLHDEWCCRPVDIAAFRQRLAEVNGDLNGERWDKLCRLLSDNQDFGLAWSY